MQGKNCDNKSWHVFASAIGIFNKTLSDLDLNDDEEKEWKLNDNLNILNVIGSMKIFLYIPNLFDMISIQGFQICLKEWKKKI